jgi:hypothetical protein
MLPTVRKSVRWLYTQRGLKKKLDRGEPSSKMTVARAARLTALGWGWGRV